MSRGSQRAGTRNLKRGRKRSRRYAKGKRAFAICDRSGFKVPYKDTIIEPGTGLRVDKRWNDGKWNRVTHPRNFPADTSESISLRDPRPDRVEPNPLFLVDENNNLLKDENGLPIILE
jgi:hypothetical protein